MVVWAKEWCALDSGANPRTFTFMPTKRGPVKFRIKRPKKLFKLPSPVYNDISKFVVNTVAKMVGEGVPYTIAAAAAGITLARLQKWRSIGEAIRKHVEEHLDYPDDITDEGHLCYSFALMLDQYTAKSAVHAIKKVRSGMGHDWRAAAWWLDRKVDGFKLNAPNDGVNPQEAQQIIYVPVNARGVLSGANPSNS